MFNYEIILDGSLVDSHVLAGIAHLKFESARLLGKASLRRVYIGDDFDPVLHCTSVYNPNDGGWCRE